MISLLLLYPIFLCTLGMTLCAPTSRLIKLQQKSYFYGSGYAGKIEIGEQAFNVIFDTGSSDFWVISADCHNQEVCGEHQQYHASRSYHPEPEDIHINYGTGSIHARVGRDTVRLANMTLQDQLFAEAVEVSPEFKDLPIDGIVGLGPPSFHRPSFVQNMLQPNALFAFHIQDQVAEIDFGGTDENQYRGDIHYAPVVGDSYWMTNISDFGFKNYSGGLRQAIIDTGTSLLITTSKDADAIHSQITNATSNNDGTYSIPCHLKGKVDDLVFTINGYQMTVPSDEYILVPSDEDDTMCLSGISGQSSKLDDGWILGLVFLKNYYTVFDVDFNRIGFAETRKGTPLLK